MSEHKRHEVVISGIAGIYPECDDVDELWDRLLNKEDMVTVDGRRWAPGEFDMPSGTGKVKNPEKFDMTFFGINRKLCEKMDPYTRLLCEQSYRAVCDAGVNPRFIDGSNTAVIMSSFSSEPEHDMGASLINQGTYNVLAFSRTMQANRLSYFLNLKGPSFQLDCSSCGGFQAMQYACDLISSGACTAAIIGSCSMINKPDVSFHYQAMGKLSEDSVTRSFSADATGYARSESCVTVFLQRKEHAKRIYATVLAAEVLSYGSKAEPFSEFPVEYHDRFLTNMYRKANVDPQELAYVEACGSASKTLDAMELNSISRTLMNGRTEPLLIGSVKSNLGHTEGTASLVSLTKLILALDRGIIAPNLHYSEPNPNVPDLVSGRMQVVTEPTPLRGDIVGVSELSVTGICSHVILKRCEKVKTEVKNPDQLPYLLTMSGRNEEVLASNLQKLSQIDIDEEFVLLLNSLYKEGIKPHVYRGYTVVSEAPSTYNMVGPAPSGEKKPIWFMYSGMGSQWPTMAKSLMDLPIFARAIQKCHDALASKGINLLEIVTKDEASMFDVILNSFVGIAAVQIGLTDVLRAVGVQPDGIIGHSVGELGCAYADGCLTAEQMILAAHARGRASVEAHLIKGMMAAVGAGYNSIKNTLPESIEVACHNSKESCTLSGPADDMTTFIAELKAKGMFAKLVNVANIAYHSRYIKPAAPALLKYLKEIIPVPVKRSSKWVSSSNLEQNWDSELAQYSSAEYHTNNLLSSVLFEEASAHVPANAIVIEIAPHGLLQAIVKKSLPQATHIPLTSRFDPNNLKYLLGALGKMFVSGIPCDLQPLYPSAKFPVGRGTLAVSPLIDWLRDENFIIRRVINDNESPSPLCRYVSIEQTHPDFGRLSSHKVNDRTVLPSQFYFDNIIDIFRKTENHEDSPIIVEDFKFVSYSEISPTSSSIIRIKLLAGTGNVVANEGEDGRLLVQGKINPLSTTLLGEIHAPDVMSPSPGSISRQDLRRFMKSMGVDRELALISLDDIHFDNGLARATAQWNSSIGEFIMTILALAEFVETEKSNSLKLIHYIREMKIDLPHFDQLPPQGLQVEYDALTRTLLCGGINISDIECKHPSLCPKADKDVLYAFEHPQFVPYVYPTPLSAKNLIAICTQLVLENTPTPNDDALNIIEVGNNADIHNIVKGIAESAKYSGALRITNFESERSFVEQGLPSLLQKDIWIIFAESPSNEALRHLTNATTGFVLMPKTNNQDDSLRVIFEANVDDSWFTLKSISSQSKRQYEVVNFTDDYLPLLQHQLLISDKLGSEATKTVILWGEIDSLITIGNILEETKNLQNNERLHYWFFLGEAPKYDFNDANLKNQVLRDVKVNISVDGLWGSLKFLPANLKNSALSPVGPSGFYFPLSSVISSHGLSAIGLNLQDNLFESANNDLGIYDYVTPTSMGLGTYNPHTKTFDADKILTWQKPNSWMTEEAATVPLLYSLASYIIHHTNNIKETNEQTILVNRALTPLSQALITLALHENMTVYATVYGEREKSALLDMFPKLKAAHVFDCSSVAFFTDVLKATRGVYKVINNFEETQMVQPCIQCMKNFGVLIYVGQSLLNSENKMGMFVFSTESIARGVSGDILMNSSVEVKTAIRSHIERALREGAVMPLRTFECLPPSTLNTDAVQVLMTGSAKMVVSVDNVSSSIENKLYFADEGKSHVIVEGKIQTDLSLNILEWLLQRGARKVVVFMRQSHPYEATSLRLQSVRNQYRWAEVDIRPSNQLSTKANIVKFVEECQGRGPAMVFFLGSGLKEKIESFDEVLSDKVPSCNVICVGKGGESVCEKRKKMSLPALFVRCSAMTLECVNFTKYLDGLISDSASAPLVLVNKCAVRNRSSHGLIADLMHVPATTTELRELWSQSLSGATFVEIPTLGPSRKHLREIYPVYLIPGLKPRRLHRMASQLYCSAMEARLPRDTSDVEQIACDLTHQLISFNQNVYTLVADDAGGVLALHIAAKLEGLLKTVNVILLDATPASTIKWANELLNNEIALIGKYLTVPDEVKSNDERTAWNEKLRLSLNTSGFTNEEDLKTTENCLNLLKSRLQGIVNAAPPPNKLKCNCYVVELSGQTLKDYGLKDYLSKEPVVLIKSAPTVNEMIDSDVAEHVNFLLLFEYKDAANTQMEDCIGVNVMKKPHWQSSLLYRVRE